MIARLRWRRSRKHRRPRREPSRWLAIPSSARFLLLAAFAAACAWTQNTYALSGTVVTPERVIEDGIVVIDGGKIRSVGPRTTLDAGVTEIQTGGVIFPGLIDVHDHLVWNVFPRWHPGKLVGDRYEWQAMSNYVQDLSGPEGKLVANGLGCEMERYAEIKAMLNGATSVVGSFNPIPSAPHRNDCDKGLARNLDFASGLYGSAINEEPLRYEIFPFEIPWKDAQTIRDGLASGTIRSLLVHVAEGKDASAHREFRMLKARGFLRAHVSVIHGVALNAADFDEMRANGVGFVWSPRSNFELYGKTADMRGVKKAGLTIALAPDWSPSGSSGVLAELRYAYEWNRRQTPPVFDDAEMVKMATANAATLAGAAAKIGTLEPGAAADLIVMPRGRTPLLALLDSRPGAIRLVVVGGRPLMGEPGLMSKLLPQAKFEAVTVCGERKALNIADDTGGEAWVDIESRLRTALTPLHITLAGLAECGSSGAGAGSRRPPN